MSLDLKTGQKLNPIIPNPASLSKQAGAFALSSVPPPLRPIVRAYALGYATAVGPRLLTLVLQALSKRRRKPCQSEDDESSFVSSALRIIKTGFEFQRFPTFCAVLVGGSSLLLVSNAPYLIFNIWGLTQVYSPFSNTHQVPEVP